MVVTTAINPSCDNAMITDTDTVSASIESVEPTPIRLNIMYNKAEHISNENGGGEYFTPHSQQQRQ